MSYGLINLLNLTLDTSERGAAFIEMTFTLLILLSFTAALLGGTLAYRQANVAAEAVRFAGRAAVPLSFDYPSYCLEEPATQDCAQPISNTPPSTLSEAAARLACISLSGASLPIGDFQAVAIIEKQLSERTITRSGIRVKIERKEPTQCAFCMLGYNLSFMEVDAVYVLEAICRG